MDFLAIIIPSLFSLVGTFIGIIATSKLTIYRIGELEKKVEKHNTIVERTYKLERDNQTAFRLIDDLKAENKEIREELRDKADKSN